MTQKPEMKYLSTALLTAVLIFTGLSQVGCESAIRLRERGISAYNAGQPELAKDRLSRAIEIRPSDVPSLYHLGLINLEMGLPLDAQLVLEKALELKQEDASMTPMIIDALAEAYFQQGREEALYNFLARIASTYATSEDFLRQARYLSKIGDMDAARAAYRKAAFFAPVDEDGPYVELALFYESINDRPNMVQALKWAWAINDQNPRTAAAFERLGIVPGPTLKELPPKPEM